MKINHRNESVSLTAKERLDLLRTMSDLSGWYSDTEESGVIRSMLRVLAELDLYAFNGEETYDLAGCQKSQVYELKCCVGSDEFGQSVFYAVDNALFKLTRYWSFPESRRVEIMAYV